jgi:3-methylcrotonyl-CoA carboxylase alpha subunit
VVTSAAEVPAAVESAQRLARTAFGDDRLLMERYFPRARHVEVQIFADSHGQTLSLFDRDCSVQRRHQKIIEEAPAPGLRDEVRAAMAQAAVKSAQAVGYIGAGTVEFLVDDAQNFYFMEMNTRLQVEHPVTELITGIDLVEWQLRIAQGERLPRTHAQITQRGFAVEARLYAEDPAKDYLPSVGQITHLRWPETVPGLRLDTGVESGDEVSTYYDPMLGKIIAWGESRATAIALLHRALSEVEIVGVATNRALLTSVLADHEFRRGAVGTDFLKRRTDLSFGEPPAAGPDIALGAVWCATKNTDNNALWEDSRGWRLAAPASTAWRFAQGNAVVELSAPHEYSVRVNDDDYAVRVLSRGNDSLLAQCQGRMHSISVFDASPVLHLFRDGRHVVLHAERTDDALQVAGGTEQGSLLTPLPGTIVAIHVATGQQVARGAPLVTVEAMKMEHTLTAPYDGVVSRIAYGLTDRVQAGATLVELSPL